MAGYKSKVAMANIAEISKIILDCSEGTVYGQTYFTVHPHSGLYARMTEKWQEMLEWMIATFGPAPKDGIWSPGGRWYANNSKFWFRDKKDFEWFLLRWQ